jgi:hypothetical protein
MNRNAKRFTGTLEGWLSIVRREGRERSWERRRGGRAGLRAPVVHAQTRVETRFLPSDRVKSTSDRHPSREWTAPRTIRSRPASLLRQRVGRCALPYGSGPPLGCARAGRTTVADLKWADAIGRSSWAAPRRSPHRSPTSPLPLPQRAERLDADPSTRLRVRDPPRGRDAERRRRELPPDGGGHRGRARGRRPAWCERPSSDEASSTTPSPARAACCSARSRASASSCASAASRSVIESRRSPRSRSRRSRIEKILLEVRPQSAQVDVVGQGGRLRLGAQWPRCPRTCLSGSRSPRSTWPGRRPRSPGSRRPGDTVVVLGAGGKSGILCAVEARQAGRPRWPCVRSRVATSPTQTTSSALGALRRRPARRRARRRRRARPGDGCSREAKAPIWCSAA